MYASRGVGIPWSSRINSCSDCSGEVLKRMLVGSREGESRQRVATWLGTIEMMINR
jgi:hypothetical protein